MHKFEEANQQMLWSTLSLRLNTTVTQLSQRLTRVANHQLLSALSFYLLFLAPSLANRNLCTKATHLLRVSLTTEALPHASHSSCGLIFKPPTVPDASVSVKCGPHCLLSYKVGLYFEAVNCAVSYPIFAHRRTHLILRLHTKWRMMRRTAMPAAAPFLF